MIDLRQLKINAKETMAQTRPRPFWVTFVVLAVSLVLSVLSLFVSGEWEMLREFSATMDYSVLIEGEGISAFAWLLNLALQLMSMVISVGYALYVLRVHRRQEAAFETVLDAFGIFFRAVWITVLQSLIFLAVSCACVIPGSLLAAMEIHGWMIAFMLLSMVVMYAVACAYSQSVFIMLDNPQFTCMQCLTLSRMAMRGHKWELFKLCLSFIGWYILSVVPFVGLWVMAYFRVTLAGYYDGLVPEFLQNIRAMPQGPQDPEAPKPTEPPRYHIPGERDDDGEEK